MHADLRDHDRNGYDFVSRSTSLHHLPFAETVARLRAMPRPGGVLAVLGIARPTLADLPHGAVASVPNQVRIALGPRRLVGVAGRGHDAPGRSARARELLPGVRSRRHLYFRYSLVC